MSFICHIHNYTEYNQQWNVCIISSGQLTLRRPGSSRGFGALLKGLTSVVDTSCQSRDSNPQPRVTSGFKSNALSIRPRLPSWRRYRGVPRPVGRHNTANVSWVFPGVSSRWDAPGTPPQEGIQEASGTDAQATSTGSSRCRGAAALLWAPPEWLSSSPYL